MPPSDDQFDLAILGGGPAGYVAAISAALRGARVILVEKQRVGGTCLNVGCIPTKVMTTAADLLYRARHAQEMGVAIPHASMDLPALMARKRSTVDQLVGGVEQLLRARRVTLLHGTATLVGPDALRVTDDDGKVRKVNGASVILAPGSVVADPPIEGHSLPGVMTSTEALEIDTVPPRLIVIGGGVIGMEFACIYEALGSQVTVLEMADSVLATATDEAVAKRLQLLVRRRGMDIQTGTIARHIERSGDVLRVVATGPSGEVVAEAERVLLAVGRWPNTHGMGFSGLGLQMNGRALWVDERLRTNLPNVWAAGDVVGGWMLAHKAMVEGRIAAENAMGGNRRADDRVTPSVIYTRPEIASAGLTEAQARSRGADVKVTQFPFSANPRARIIGEPEGFVRLICQAGSGKILGVHILGAHATDLIAEGALAVQLGMTANDLAWTTHAHPTLPEAMLEAALGFGDGTIHALSR